jgi:queuine tRNA-ribosyltransferase
LLTILVALDFSIANTDGAARAATFIVNGKQVSTPVFMPVGTAGSVKAVPPEVLETLGAEICLGNTYHLYLRPGVEIIKQAGGLHRFSSWNGAILTDSGGYQVYSLEGLRSVDDDGVDFRSHLDGSAHRFTPESVYDTQTGLGSDIIMPLDVCTPYPVERDQAASDLKKTISWARRSAEHHERCNGRTERTLFGIVQGSVYADLRRESVDALRDIGFEGYSIGGLSVGEPKDAMLEMLDATVGHLPAESPRYLMGVGTPVDLLDGISRGIDMFDCVMPTRNARNGTAFTSEGPIPIKAARYSEDYGPLDRNCDCSTCGRYPRAYLRHLFNAGEISAMILTTRHNLHFYLTLMRRARRAIVEGRWNAFVTEFMEDYHQGAKTAS